MLSRVEVRVPADRRHRHNGRRRCGPRADPAGTAGGSASECVAVIPTRQNSCVVELGDLRYLVALAKEGSFTRAATRSSSASRR